MKNVLLMFAVLAALASAAENVYRFTLQEPASLNGTQLRPGDYKIQVRGDKAILKFGKTVVGEVPAKLETAEHKFHVTTVDLDGINSNPRIKQIQIDGTNVRIVFAGTIAGQQVVRQ